MNNFEIELLMKEVGSIGGYVMESNQMFANLIRHTKYGDFNRTDWQLINHLNTHQSLQLQVLMDFLVHFEPEKEARNQKLNSFLEMNIIELLEDVVTITDFGKNVFQAIYQAQKDILIASFKDINANEYTITIKVLKQMIQNMEPYMH